MYKQWKFEIGFCFTLFIQSRIVLCRNWTLIFHLLFVGSNSLVCPMLRDWVVTRNDSECNPEWRKRLIIWWISSRLTDFIVLYLNLVITHWVLYHNHTNYGTLSWWNFTKTESFLDKLFKREYNKLCAKCRLIYSLLRHAIVDYTNKTLNSTK